MTLMEFANTAMQMYAPINRLMYSESRSPKIYASMRPTIARYFAFAKSMQLIADAKGVACLV
jgi:hypothetical protein